MMAAVEQTKAVKAIGNSVEDEAISGEGEGEAISGDGEGCDGRADGEGEKARRGSRLACSHRLEGEFNNDTFESKPCQFIYMRTVSKELRG